jgi:hypothetical protein
VVSRGTDKVMAIDANDSVTRTVGKAKTLKGARALAFAPFRFKFGAKGSFAGDAPKAQKLKQSAILTISPGSQTVMLEFLNSSVGPGLENVFGSDVVVLPSVEAYYQNDLKKRRLHGEWFSGPSNANGIGSLTMTVGGKPNKKGFFMIKRAKGLFLQAGDGGVFIGRGKSGKRLK